MSIELRDIVKEWLHAHGYDGLFNPDIQCACVCEDLIPCDDFLSPNCTAGYKWPCGEATEFCDGDGDCHWHIALTKYNRESIVEKALGVLTDEEGGGGPRESSIADATI